MATAVYDTRENVIKLLPRGYDNVVELPDSLIDSRLAEKSRVLDGLIGEIWTPFNSPTGTPPTPGLISETVRWMTAADLIPIIEAYTRNTQLQDMAKQFEKSALERVIGLKGGDDDLNIEPLIIPDVTITDETITWGTGADEDLDPTEAFIVPTTLIASGETMTLLIDTVRVTAPAARVHSRNGQDFEPYFHPTHNRWVLRDTGGRLHGTAGVKISYRASFRRYIGIQETIGVESSEWLP